MANQISPALLEFIKRVTSDLVKEGWSITGDGECPEDLTETDLSRSIIEHSKLLESDDYFNERKRLRIIALKQELESLTN